MVFRANVLKVMIASPGDVTEERSAITEEIYRWNDANASARQLVLLPVKWETHSTPEMGGHPQEIIGRQLLDDADIVIGIFGTRIGTPTSGYMSGTVEEIKKHVAAGKTAKVYFSEVPISPSELNPAQYALVQEFREECRSTGLYATFDSIRSFSRDFSHHLNIELNQPRYRWLAVPGPQSIGNAFPTPDALRLLRAAAVDDGTVILQESVGAADGLRIGNEEFIDGTPRSAARWRAALAELETSDALERTSEGLYRVTSMGYRIADATNASTGVAPSPFEEQHKLHIRELSNSLNYTQRDLLRFLLLQGGSARGDVVHKAWTNPSIGFDWNGLTRALADKGLISLNQDPREGYSTVFVNESLVDALKGVLFPRDEGSNGSNFIRV